MHSGIPAIYFDIGKGRLDKKKPDAVFITKFSQLIHIRVFQIPDCGVCFIHNLCCVFHTGSAEQGNISPHGIPVLINRFAEAGRGNAVPGLVEADNREQYL